MLKKILNIIKIILLGLMGYIIFRGQKPKKIKVELGKIKLKKTKPKKTKFNNKSLDNTIERLR